MNFRAGVMSTALEYANTTLMTCLVYQWLNFVISNWLKYSQSEGDRSTIPKLPDYKDLGYSQPGKLPDKLVAVLNELNEQTSFLAPIECSEEDVLNVESWGVEPWEYMALFEHRCKRLDHIQLAMIVEEFDDEKSRKIIEDVKSIQAGGIYSLEVNLELFRLFRTPRFRNWYLRKFRE
jgi:hypothetical protein